MVERCNAVGVNVMADLVINHMSGHGMSGTGSGGSGFDGDSLVRIVHVVSRTVVYVLYFIQTLSYLRTI